MSAITHDLAKLAPIGSLTEWLDAHVPDLGSGPLQTSVLSGGQSNVVLTLNRAFHLLLHRIGNVRGPENDYRSAGRLFPSPTLAAARRTTRVMLGAAALGWPFRRILGRVGTSRGRRSLSEAKK